MTDIELPSLPPVQAPSGLSDVNRKIYDDMVHYMKLKLQRPFTAPKIIMLVASGVKFLAKVKTLTGPEKKDLVLHAIRQVVDKSSYIADEEKIELLMLIDTFGSDMVEVLVDFARDAYTFIKNKLKGWTWCPDCIRRTEPEVTSHDRSAVLGTTENLAEYEALVQYMKLKFHKPITGPKIILIIAAGVKYVEHYKDLSGAEKKDVVIHAIRNIIQDSDLSDEDKVELTDVVDTFADDTIDYLVDFGKNMYLKVKEGCCSK